MNQLQNTAPSRGFAAKSQLREVGRGGRDRHAFLAIALAIVTLVFGNGCHVLMAPAAIIAAPVRGIHNHLCYNETIDDFAIEWRNRARARKAWKAERHRFAGHPHIHDLEKGFKDGYVEAASGAPGCLPITPPRSYWGWKHHSQCGQEQINTWFEGFPYGVAAAEQEGVVYYSQLPISDTILTQIEQHHPHRQFRELNAPSSYNPEIYESFESVEPPLGEALPMSHDATGEAGEFDHSSGTEMSFNARQTSSEPLPQTTSPPDFTGPPLPQIAVPVGSQTAHTMDVLNEGNSENVPPLPPVVPWEDKYDESSQTWSSP